MAGQQRDAEVVIFGWFERDFCARPRPHARMALSTAGEGSVELRVPIVGMQTWERMVARNRSVRRMEHA
jgi:hypothetical protein